MSQKAIKLSIQPLEKHLAFILISEIGDVS